MCSEPPRHRPAVLYFTVSITGMAVMVIELLGTRVIAPFYGASLYVWTSLISVTLVALAAGYYLGGRWSDRSAGRGLAFIIALAGVATLLIPGFSRPVLLASNPLGLRAGALVSALVLFFPSLALLGMVGPFAIKLATERLAGVGTAAGNIYAVSTFGSVVGTLALGFFLFPLLGSREILVITGLILLGLALGLAFWERQWGGRSVKAVAALCGLGVLPILLFGRSAGTESLGNTRWVFEQESLYGWVRVLDQPERDVRLLASDASVIGASSLKTGETLLQYQQVVGRLPTVWPSIHRALLIGQGAGHLAMAMQRSSGVVTETIEIDPAVALAAEQFFDFKPSGRHLVGDARRELLNLKEPYDLIIHDCFTGGTEPVHLLTEETFQNLRALLKPGGVLALNTVAFYEGGHNPALSSIVRTVAAVFPQVRVFKATAEEDFNDFIVLASDRPIDFPVSGAGEELAAWFREREARVETSGGVLLTDNFNPLEKLQLPKAEKYRAMVAEGLGPDLMLR